MWQITLDDIATVYLHPRDVGGALLSLDEPRPPASWRWAGPEWEAGAHGSRLILLTGAAVLRALGG